ADGEPADRQRADGNGSERSRADRKRDHAGGGNGFGSANDSTRHRWSPSGSWFSPSAGGEHARGPPAYPTPRGPTPTPPPPDGGGAIPICRRCGEQVACCRVNITSGRGTA